MTPTAALPSVRSLTDVVPAELLFCIAEHVCWDNEAGWDASRLVPFAQGCRFIFMSVRPLLRSSIHGYLLQPLKSGIDSLRISNDYRAIRSITVNVLDHRFNTSYAAASRCILPFVALCSNTLVHLDLPHSEDLFLYELARCVDPLPRVRYLNVGGYNAYISIGALASVARRCPALEMLMAGSLHGGGYEAIPSFKAPFRLRYLYLYAGRIDAAALAWICSASSHTLEHLSLDSDYGELLEATEDTDEETDEQEMACLAALKAV